MTAILWLVVPSRSTNSAAGGSSFSINSLREIMLRISNRSIFTIVCIQLLGFWIWQGFTGFYPLYLTEVKEISPEITSILFGFFFFARDCH
jgi:hypothetical protein